LIKPIHEVVFSKARICRKFLLDLQYGGKEFLGLRLDDLFIIQGCAKLFFSRERNGNSMLSSFVRSNYEWALLHLGIGHHKLFGLAYETLYCLLPRVWIKSLWEFISKYNIELPSRSCDFKLYRVGDEFLV